METQRTDNLCERGVRSKRRENNEEDDNVKRMENQRSSPYQAWESDTEANSSDQWGYVTDLVPNCLDRLDWHKRFVVHVNREQINNFGSKYERKGQDECKVNFKLKYSELYGYLNQKIRGWFHPSITIWVKRTH